MQDHGVQVVTLKEVGHFPMMEAEARFNTILRKIVLERLLAPKGADY
jgi:pimeloyl-ACP methyl ester carboxylesterase